MQNHKSLCAAALTCANPVNIQAHTHRQTDRHHFDQLIRIAQPAELKSSLEDRKAKGDSQCSNSTNFEIIKRNKISRSEFDGDLVDC